MSNILSTKKTSAIFLATILVAGVIGISSSFVAFGQEYDYEKNYDSYDESYAPYDPAMEYDKSDSPSKSSICDNRNFNIIDVNQAQIQRQSEEIVPEEALDGQQLTPEEDELVGNGNGDPLRNIDRSIEDVCKNDNDNTLIATFTGAQAQASGFGGASTGVSVSDGETTTTP